MKLIVILNIFLVFTLSYPQKQIVPVNYTGDYAKDSLLNLTLAIKGFNYYTEPGTDVLDHKCGFSFINRVKFEIAPLSLTPDVIKSVFSRPVNQFSTVTSSGIFRIHYDTSGTHKIRYSLPELIKAVDSSYRYLTGFLGFPAPPSDGSDGGDNLYDIYVQNIEGIYGYTEMERNLGNNKYSSYIVIDNDFEGNSYNTKGLNAAKVTVAHEMFHAIQSGNYRYFPDDTYFYELSSTAVEEFIFDEVNDYYYYMNGLFNKPYLIFSEHSGYDLALWNIYLKKYFDKTIFKSQWEYFTGNRALVAIKKSIDERGSSFKTEFSKFFVHNHFTGYRSEPTKYYKEGINYPLMKTQMNVPFLSPKKEISGFADAVSLQYYLITDSVMTPGVKDSIYLFLVNTNIDSALNWKINSKSFAFNYTISVNKLNDNYLPLTKNLFYFCQVPDKQNWSDLAVINDSNYTPVQDRNNDEGTPFPSPFFTARNKFINFYVKVDDPLKDYQISILSSSMDYLFSESLRPFIADDGKWIIRIPEKSLNSRDLNSGIYFYVITSGDYIKKGKFAVINDK